MYGAKINLIKNNFRLVNNIKKNLCDVPFQDGQPKLTH